MSFIATEYSSYDKLNEKLATLDDSTLFTVLTRGIMFVVIEITPQS